MSGHVKTADGWKAMTKIPARIDTGLEEVVSGWHKMDTGWVRIWSSGAMIEYLDYPYPIPVMAGWEYSEDGVTWTKAEEDRDLYVPSAGEYMDFTNATASWAIDSADGGHYVKFSGITRVQTTYSHYKVYFTARRTDGTEFEFSDSFNINTNYGSTLSNIDTSFLKVNKFEVTDGWDGEIVETFIPADAYKFTGFVKTKSTLSLENYENGTTFDWDFSKIDFTGESSGDGVNWSWFYVFPYATGPDITKVVFTYSDGTITEVSATTQYSMAWPSNGSGIFFESPMSDSSKTTVSIDYYSDNIHLATATAPQDNGYGEYKSEVVYNPDLGVKIPVTEGSTYDINDWDVSGATYNLNGGVSHFTVSGVTGSVPTCTGIRLQHEGWITAGFEPRIIPVSGNNPNDTYIGISSPMIGTTITILQLLDEDGNVLADFLNPDIDTKIVANTSKVLSFNSPVTGTVKYAKGDLLPALEITVTDDSGNVIEGAEITILGNDWDLSNASVSTVSGATNTISGITGSFPVVTTMVIIIQEGMEKTLDVSDNNPNMIYQGSIPMSLTTIGIRLLDAEGNTVAYRSDVPRTSS